MVVVLPAPLGPRKPCTSPAATSRSSPSSARVAPNVLTSRLTPMALGPATVLPGRVRAALGLVVLALVLDLGRVGLRVDLRGVAERAGQRPPAAGVVRRAV